MTNRKHNSLLAVSFALALLTSLVASAQTWTAVASTCAIGDAHINRYEVDGPKLSYLFDSTGVLTARCNITNPLNSGNPSWFNLSVGCSDPDGTGKHYRVYVSLKRVDRSSGVTSTVTALDSNDWSDTGAFEHLQSFGSSEGWDFNKYSYYINLELTRDYSTKEPKVWSVRLSG